MLKKENAENNWYETITSWIKCLSAIMLYYVKKK